MISLNVKKKKYTFIRVMDGLGIFRLYYSPSEEKLYRKIGKNENLY